jgi:hypothetical protein
VVNYVTSDFAAKLGAVAQKRAATTCALLIKLSSHALITLSVALDL